MPLSRDEFVRKYRHKWGAMILFMQASEVKGEGTLARTARIFDMPQEVEQLLGLMYDDLFPQPKPSPSQANGQHQKGEVRK